MYRYIVFALLCIFASVAIGGSVISYDVTFTSSLPTYHPFVVDFVPPAGSPPGTQPGLTGYGGVSDQQPYYLLTFQVEKTGDYVFSTDNLYQANGQGVDTLLYIFSTFDPAHPDQNILYYNDDIDTYQILKSRIEATLTQGVTYYMVLTTWNFGTPPYTVTLTYESVDGYDITRLSVAPVASTTQNTPVIITGAVWFEDFTAVEVSIDGVECLSPSVISNSEIHCTAQPGLGQGVNLNISWAGGSTAANIFNYEAAVDVHVCGATAPQVLEPAKGQTTVTICGSNFGLPQYTPDHAIAVTFPYALPGTIIFHSETQLIVQIPVDGAGINTITVRFAGQRVIVADVLVKYPGPLVEEITVKETHARTATGTVLIWKGLYFGVPESNIVITAIVGNYPCFRINHISTTVFECSVLLGPGHNLPSFATIAAQINPAVGPGSFRFDVPAEAVTLNDGAAVAFAASCTAPHGSPDGKNLEICNCWSSYVPSNELQTECKTQAKCAGNILAAATVIASPSRPATTFVDDRLEIVQTIQIEQGRRDTNIQFLAPALPKASMLPSVDPGTFGSDTCIYPGTLWVKKINELDCLDEFHASIPWSQHALCGFVEQVDAATLASNWKTFKTYMLTTSNHIYKAHDGKHKIRISQVGYLVTVTFARQLKVFSSLVSVVIADIEAPVSLTVEVDGSIVYDVASKNTIVTFDTTVVWPYQLKGPLPGTWHTANSETGAVDTLITLESAPACTKDQDTECEQHWVMILNTTEVCNLKGSVNINTNALECRDYTTVGPCASAPNTNFTIHIGSTNLCSNSEVDASKGLTATLQSYYDVETTIDQNIFQTGDMVYFVLTVTDPISTIDRITFSDITLSKINNVAATDVLFHQATPGAALSTATQLAGVELNITKEIGEVFISAGENGVLAFNFRLLRNKLNVVQTLASPTEETSSIRVTVTLDVFYHGNEKRTVVATTSTPAMVEHQLSFYTAETDDEAVATTQDDVLDTADAALAAWEQSSATATTVSVVAAALCVFMAIFA